MAIFGPYRVGDVPASTLEWTIETDDDLSPYVDGDATASLRAMDDTETATPATTFEEAEGGYLVSIGTLGAEPFPTPGRYTLTVTLTAGSNTLQLDPLVCIVEQEDGWHTLASARDEWSNSLDDVVLWMLLAVAKDQVLLYAPYIEDDAPVPINYRQGQLTQARNILNASRVGPGGDTGGDEFALTPHPLDWHIRQLLRPRRGVPKVG